MFVRIKRTKTSTGRIIEYLVVVENKRIQGKVRQRDVANLGRLDLFQETNIADLLIHKIKDYTKTLKLMDTPQRPPATSAKNMGLFWSCVSFGN